jgi:hypothetical protein
MARPLWAAMTAAAAAWAVAGAAGEPPSRPATAASPADPSPAEQARICFPRPQSRPVRTGRTDAAAVLTDTDVDFAPLLADLGRAETVLAELVGPAGQTGRPVLLAVYARQEDYLALWGRVGRHYGGRFGRIETTGYSYRVFAATTASAGARTRPASGPADDRPGRPRPRLSRRRRAVLAHEFAHVRLYQRLGLPNDGNWLTEGIASAVQLRLHPGAGERAEYLRWLETGRRLPLKRLMDAPRIRPRDYWQAATLVEAIAAERPGGLKRVISAYVEGRPASWIVREVLRTNFPDLEKRWARHVRRAAATRPTPQPAQ